jgi:HlyD family secretion protein
MGDSAPALVIPNGAFYQSTGGNWIYVLTSDGKEAVRRDIRLGRRNSESVEVLEGLSEGERVIVSSYGNFAEDVDRLKLASE